MEKKAKKEEKRLRKAEKVSIPGTETENADQPPAGVEAK